MACTRQTHFDPIVSCTQERAASAEAEAKRESDGHATLKKRLAVAQEALADAAEARGQREALDKLKSNSQSIELRLGQLLMTHRGRLPEMVRDGFEMDSRWIRVVTCGVVWCVLLNVGSGRTRLITT